MRRIFLYLLPLVLCAQTKPRARDLGVPFEGAPGLLNAITDVAGVEVGQVTLISDDGPATRTGVTAVLPRGRTSQDAVFGAWYSQNGNGEMTGTTWLEESGFLDGPVFITNTHSVGTVRDAYIRWQVSNNKRPATNNMSLDDFFSLPVVAETWDGYLNDINGFHVRPEHVDQVMERAAPGRVAEGNVGGGTGMVCYGFKGGIGTSSRTAKGYTVGVLVQCNCGRRQQLVIAGVPVGREISEGVPYASNKPWVGDDVGSIIIVVATDAPLLPTQLKRLARRATMGLARTGSTSGNSSGDIFIAFSTANRGLAQKGGPVNVAMLPNEEINPLFQATVEATEEAIVNAMVGAETMTGFNGHRVIGLPHEQLREVMRKYKR